jgi:hypothetical protein
MTLEEMTDLTSLPPETQVRMLERRLAWCVARAADVRHEVLRALMRQAVEDTRRELAVARTLVPQTSASRH